MSKNRQKGLSTSGSKVSITQTFLDRLKMPDPSGRDRHVWDTKLPGFGVRVSGRGASASFIVQRDVRGRVNRNGNQLQRTITLGRVGVLALADARDRARSLLDQMAQGIDPKEAEAERQANQITLADLLDRYLKTKHGLAETTRDGYRRAIDTYFDNWRTRNINTISRADVLDQRDAIIRAVRENKGVTGQPQGSDKTGLAAAEYAITVLRALLGFAIERELGGLTKNPAQLPKGQKYSPPPRTRVLGAEEFAPLYGAIQALDNIAFRYYLTLVLFTGMRRSESAGLAWSDVNLTDQEHGGVPARSIRLRAERTKGKKERIVPLTDFLLDRLIELRRLGLSTHWLFPAVQKSERGHIADGLVPLQQITEQVGIPHTTLHDLRRSYITTAASLNLPYALVVELAGHAPNGRDITAVHYIHTNLADLRQAQQTVTDRLKVLCGITEPAEAENVTALAQRREVQQA
ncbi:integrase family protein [Aquisalimonas lutea]|uniref:tyrosine-type recombinase/integrase n=1 Tax=Aquisalimonas lutea TaxID=1327750 RepID=UPI0025B2F518|nr:integrase family protein [Aquisalimonas lutea]MDN3518169.1 integrase family protein [Aquisalimonas lutea]